MIRPPAAPFPLMALAALLAPLLSAPAAAAPAAVGKPVITRSATVFGNDPCPKAASPDEIVVCAREPENERYRLPKRFRGRKQEAEAVSGSWANTARSLDQASAPQMPNSCSAQGSFGQSGCMMQMLSQYTAEKRAARAARAQQAEDIDAIAGDR